jgi:putative antitoxin of VapBC-like toxin-antitoxin system
MCGGLHVATNLSIDPDLLKRALEVSGEQTEKAAVTRALEEFIARRRQKRILDLMSGAPNDRSGCRRHSATGADQIVAVCLEGSRFMSNSAIVIDTNEEEACFCSPRAHPREIGA